jgi:glycosyltransferase involved in cell wall biosynthesis
VVLVIGQLELGGGAERQLSALAAGLHGEGFRPSVVSLRAGPADDRGDAENYWAHELRARGIPVREIQRAGHRDLRRIIPLARFFREEAPEIVHSFMFSANAYARVATLLSGRRPILVISERTGRLPHQGMERSVGYCLRRWADGIITNAEASRRMLMAHGSTVPIWVVPNGIDVSEFLPHRRAEARAALGVPADAPLLGTVARMSAEKNYPFFVRLVSEVQRSVPGLRAIAIGDGPLRPLVDQDVRRHRLEGVLTLLGRTDRVANLLPAFDVFVLVSEYEGLPNAVMEAQASAVPCVVSDVGGNAEIVLENRTGYLVPAQDLALFSTRVIALLLDGALREGLGREARRRMETAFSLEAMVSATADVYRHLLRAGRRGVGMERP